MRNAWRWTTQENAEQMLDDLAHKMRIAEPAHGLRARCIWAAEALNCAESAHRLRIQQMDEQEECN